MLIYIFSRYKESYSTMQLVKKTKEKGHDVRVLDYALCELVFNPSPNVFYHGSLLPIPDVIIPRIGASSTSVGAYLIRHYESMDVKTLTTSFALLHSRDKLKAFQLLATREIALPKTYFSGNIFNFKTISQTIGNPPYVFKLIESTQGLGVFLPLTKLAVQDLIDTYTRRKEGFIIQEYIKESKGTDIRCFVIGNKVVAAMKRMATSDDFRSNLHRGGTAIAVDLTPEEKQMAIESTKLLGLSVAGVDILRSNRGPLVLEVNSSPGIEGIEKYTQVDIAGLMIDKASKL